jgi:hypothetical protein
MAQAHLRLLLEQRVRMRRRLRRLRTRHRSDRPTRSHKCHIPHSVRRSIAAAALVTARLPSIDAQPAQRRPHAKNESGAADPGGLSPRPNQPMRMQEEERRAGPYLAHGLGILGGPAEYAGMIRCCQPARE